MPDSEAHPLVFVNAIALTPSDGPEAVACLFVVRLGPEELRALFGLDGASDSAPTSVLGEVWTRIDYGRQPWPAFDFELVSDLSAEVVGIRLTDVSIRVRERSPDSVAWVVTRAGFMDSWTGNLDLETLPRRAAELGMLRLEEAFLAQTMVSPQVASLTLMRWAAGWSDPLYGPCPTDPDFASRLMMSSDNGIREWAVRHLRHLRRGGENSARSATT